MNNTIEMWSEQWDLVNEGRQAVIESVTNPKYTYLIPNGLEEYEVRDLEKDDLYNDFDGVLKGVYVSKDEVGYIHYQITPKLLNEKLPIFIILEVLEDRDDEKVVMEKMILRCKSYFEKEYTEAKQLALEQAKADLLQ